MKKLIRSNCHFILSLILLCCFEQFISAQPGGFQISNYKNPNYRYQSLEGTFNIDTDLAHGNTQMHADSLWYESGHAKLASNINLNYLSNFNSLKYQRDQYISAALYSTLQSLSSETSDITSSGGSNLTGNFNYSSNNRFYFHLPYYFEVSPSASFSINNSGSHNQYKSTPAFPELNIKYRSQQLYSGIQLQLGIGKGRIEAVQDAAMASYILEDLNRLNRINPLKSSEQVNDLAKLITQLKTSRYFDARLRKIAEINAMDSLLLSEGLRKNSDAAYFTALNDNWLFANNPERLNGYRLYAGLSPKFSFSRFISERDTTDPTGGSFESKETNIYPGLKGAIGFKHEKAVNLRWQRSANIEIAYDYNFSERTNEQILPVLAISNEIYDTKSQIIRSQARYAIGYYPNSRTWMNLAIYSSVYYEIQDLESDFTGSYEGKSSYSFQLTANYSVYYYVTERLRVEGSIYCSKRNNENNSGENSTPDVSNITFKSNSITGGVTGKLTYSIL